MKNRNTSHHDLPQHKIPDLEIIDLEQTDEIQPSSADSADDSQESYELQESAPGGRERGRKGPLSHLNIHIVLLAVTVIFVICIVYKVMNFGVRINLDEIFSDGPGTYDDTFDTILPLIDASNNPVYKDFSQGSTILAFGNAPFADDRGSDDNLVSIMREMTGANIYNCSISGSYLATEQVQFDPEISPWDAFNVYWLCNILNNNETIRNGYQRTLEILGDSAPPEAAEVYDILTSVDMDSVDAVVIMYDASDYLDAHKIYSDTNPTDPTYFTGGLEAAIEYLQYYFPNTRIIVLSPTYAFALDDNGEYISSDIKRFSPDLSVLSTYVIKQYASCAARSVTFVDNLYGTITEDNARDYLTDHLHLNLKGRKKVAERFAYALNYFNQTEQVTDPE